ncbi:MAG: rod shape-determining protein MreD [Alphaproteobacteria bacterium]
MQTFLQQLDTYGRHSLPFLVTLLTILLTVVAGPLPDMAAITPLFPLMAVYYWSVFRPDLLRLPGLFVLGVILDALTQLPLGLSALSFIITSQLVQSLRHIFSDQSYPTLWLGFATLVTSLQTLHWIILSLCAGKTLPLWPVLLQTLFTLALFPVCAWVLILLQRHVVR